MSIDINAEVAKSIRVVNDAVDRAVLQREIAGLSQSWREGLREKVFAESSSMVNMCWVPELTHCFCHSVEWIHE